MRRKKDSLVPFEVAILKTARAFTNEYSGTFYGYELAALLPGYEPSRLVGFGSLYRALGRLKDMGYLIAEWETALPDTGRPRRRLYRLTNKE